MYFSFGEKDHPWRPFEYCSYVPQSLVLNKNESGLELIYNDNHKQKIIIETDENHELSEFQAVRKMEQCKH